MSQKKVDEKKYIKKHRKEIERKKKIKTVAICVAVCLVIGAMIGVPAGINAYRSMPKFVGDSTLAAFVSTYIDEHYPDELDIVNSMAEDETETTENDEYESAVEEAVGEDLDVVDEDNIDEVLDSDKASEDESGDEAEEETESDTESQDN